MTAVNSMNDLASVVSDARKAQGSLRTVAKALHVGPRFLSEFERGKPTAEVGKALSVLQGLGLNVVLVPKETGSPGNARRLSELLGLDFPYDWSNRNMDEEVFIRNVLEAQRFDDVLKLVEYFGFDRVSGELQKLDSEKRTERIVEILSRIAYGMLTAQGAPSGAAP